MKKIFFLVLWASLFFANFAFAALPFEDNFDSYANGSNINGQGGWITLNNEVVVSNLRYVSSPNSLYFSYALVIARREVDDLGEGVLTGKVWITDNTSWFNIGLRKTDNTEYACVITLDSAQNKAYIDQYAYKQNLLSDLSLVMAWNTFTFSFRASDDKFKLCVGEVCSDWSDCYYGGNVKTFDTIDGINFRADDHGVMVYIEDISFSAIGCDSEHCNLCEDFGSCIINSCCWYSNPYLWPNLNYCDFCESSLCGEGGNPCTGCLLEEDCDEVEECYWNGSVCLYGPTICGPDSSCAFCNTQETCEAQGCEWYDDFCYIPSGVVGSETMPIISGWFNSFLTLINRVPISYIVVFTSWVDNLDFDEADQATTLSLDFTPLIGGEGEVQAIDFTQFSDLDIPFGEDSITFQDLAILFSRIFCIFVLVLFARYWISWVFD